MGGKELELLFYASPLFLSLRFTFLKPKAVFIYIVRIPRFIPSPCFIPSPQSVVRSPQSAVRSPCFILTGSKA